MQNGKSGNINFYFPLNPCDLSLKKFTFSLYIALTPLLEGIYKKLPDLLRINSLKGKKKSTYVDEKCISFPFCFDGNGGVDKCRLPRDLDYNFPGYTTPVKQF